MVRGFLISLPIGCDKITLMKKTRPAQTVIASLAAAVIFLGVTIIVWVNFPQVREWVKEKLPLVYEYIPWK